MKLLKHILLMALFIPIGMKAQVLNPMDFKFYIDAFNRNDDELYQQTIPNSKAWVFLQENIPFFECPDKQLEQTYYFRWWTYRKHIKHTPEGYIITEFLPDVPWAGKHNAISCPAAHHFYEGRWLKNARYLCDYAKFWFEGGGNPRLYSFWAADAIRAFHSVHPDDAFLKDMLPLLVANFREWENTHLDSNGLFWQSDNRDGMEVSISGIQGKNIEGYRATINSYMYGDAKALSEIAIKLGNQAIGKDFAAKALRIKSNLLSLLWDEEAAFFKVIPRGKTALEKTDVRELHGYTPWYFAIPEDRHAVAWDQLMDREGFWAPYGPTTAEQRHPDFRVAYDGHECQWNGPSWPFATTITLKAMANLLQGYQQHNVNKRDYLELLLTYSQSHQRVNEYGISVPWIDENLNPYTGDWIARTRLKNWPEGSWPTGKGGRERGKDYNHSSFCDLVISGLVGLRAEDSNTLVIDPLLPNDTWDYFCLDHVSYRGKVLTILYDRTGAKYKKGKGFRVFVDHVLQSETDQLQTLILEL